MKKRSALATLISRKIIFRLLCEDGKTVYRICKECDALSYQHHFRKARDRIKGKFIKLKKKKKGDDCFLKYEPVAKDILQNIRIYLADYKDDRLEEIRPLKKHIHILEKVFKTHFFKLYLSQRKINNYSFFVIIRIIWAFIKISTENIEMEVSTYKAVSRYFDHIKPNDEIIKDYNKSYSSIKNLRDIYYLYFKD